MTYFNRFDKRGTRILGGVLTAVLWSSMSHAQTNRLILQETFETYKTVKALRANWPGGPAQLVTNAPGGSQCAAHDGTGMNRRGGFFVFADATHNVVLSADFYDFGTNTDQNVTVSINGDDTHDNISIGMKGPFCYVARVGGFSSKTNWIPFRRRQLPVIGWHRFKAVISATNVLATIDFGIDGKIDRTMDIPFNRPVPTFTQLRFGGYSGKLAERGTVLVDNIKLELITLEQPPTLARAEVAEQPTNSPPATGVSNGIVSRPNAETNNAGAMMSAAPRLDDQSNKAELTSNFLAASPHVAWLELPNPPSALTAPRNDGPPVLAWWLGGALAMIIVLLGVVIALIRRQTKAIPRALLGQESEADKGGLAVIRSNDHWRERALQAEAVAAQQAQILKEKVGPELVRFAKETLVQGLYTQRSVLMDTQAKAQQTLSELEERLSELRLPAPERIQAYENRIAELEKQLESRNDEMRELTRATLLLIQKKLEQERQREAGPRFN